MEDEMLTRLALKTGLCVRIRGLGKKGVVILPVERVVIEEGVDGGKAVYLVLTPHLLLENPVIVNYRDVINWVNKHCEANMNWAVLGEDGRVHVDCFKTISK